MGSRRRPSRPRRHRRSPRRLGARADTDSHARPAAPGRDIHRGLPLIVVAGEALVDLVAQGPGNALTPFLGGGPFNIALAAARLGASVAFMGALSTDPFGERQRRVLADAGVDLRLTTTSPRPTTLALAEVDAAGRAAYSFYLDGTAGLDLPGPGAPPDAPDAAEALTVGSLALLAEPAATRLESFAMRASSRVPLLVDPNVRPGAVADRPAYEARLWRLFERATIVKASDDDLAYLSPAGDWEAVARRVVDCGAGAVVATLGPAGASVRTKDGEVRVPARDVVVADTIAAGDVFLGAFLAWSADRHLFRDGGGRLTSFDYLVPAVEWASRAAAWTCARAGAAIPTLAALR